MKDFLYNPVFRVGVYFNAWLWLKFFMLIALFFPKLHSIIRDYNIGKNGSAAIIGFTSSIFYCGLLVILIYNEISFSYKLLIQCLILYFLTSLMGLLSLVKYRDSLYRTKNTSSEGLE